MAGCSQDLEQDSNYMKCFMGFAMYIQEKMVDSQDMISVMCSPAGQHKAQCVFEYAKQCPEIMQPSGTGDPGMSAILGQLGNLKTMCSMFSGPCSKIQKCVQQGPEPEDYPDSTPGPTPFSNFPSMLASVCGPVKAKLDCLEGNREECPDIVKMIENIVRGIAASSSDNEGMTNLDAIMRFTKTKCPKVPKAIGTNACVKGKLKSENFQECYREVASTYDTPDKMKSCGAYLAGKKCIEESVGQCGADEANAIVMSAALFIEGTPDNCQVEDNGRSGRSGIQASILTMIATATLFALLFRN